LLINNNHQRKH